MHIIHFTNTQFLNQGKNKIIKLEIIKSYYLKFNSCGKATLKKRILLFSYLLGGSDGKESACNEGDPASIPGLGRSPGNGNGNPFQYSCLENPIEGGAWNATVQGVTKSLT